MYRPVLLLPTLTPPDARAKSPPSQTFPKNNQTFRCETGRIIIFVKVVSLKLRSPKFRSDVANCMQADRQEGPHLLPALEVRVEVRRPQSMRVVDVATDLLPLAVHVSDKNYGGELSVANQLLSIAEGEQEWRHAQILGAANQVSSRRTAREGAGGRGRDKREGEKIRSPERKKKRKRE